MLASNRRRWDGEEGEGSGRGRGDGLGGGCSEEKWPSSADISVYSQKPCFSLIDLCLIYFET